MKILLTVILCTMSMCSMVSQKTIKRLNAAGVEETWQLSLGDDFNGSSVDTKKWKVTEGLPRDGYQESSQVWFTKDNIEVSNGVLKLVIKNDTVVDKPFEIWIKDRMVPLKASASFTSGEITAREQTGFGMYEIRCRLPKSRGFNSAFWMYGEKDGVNNEIDVFEYWDVEGPLKLRYSEKRLCRRQQMTAHYKGRMTLEGDNSEDMSEGFHIFTCIYDECRIEWWRDGELVRTLYRYEGMRGKGKSCLDFLKRKKKEPAETVFPRDPMAIIATVTVMKPPHGPEHLNLFPLSMDIDYIRYYEKVEGNRLK